MKHFFLTSLFIFCLFKFSIVFSQDPLINYQFSSLDEAPWNVVVNGINPYGDNVPLLENIGDNGYNGFFIEDIVIDVNVSYRFSFWAKLSDINPEYFGGWIVPTDTAGNSISDGIIYENQSTDNGVFLFSNASPILPQIDEWYLIVGFIRSNTDSNTYTGAIYNTSGNIVASLIDQNLKWNTNVDEVFFRSLYVSPDQTNHPLYYFDPRVQVVSGGDDSVDDLLPEITTPPNTSSVWSEDNSVASYLGKVGIGTTNPENYTLAVNGPIRGREIRVDQDIWPDYVFKDEYILLSIENLQKYIKDNGHLPNIPSSNEVEKNGIALGEMNKLLLEKIEELTLYIIDMNDEIKKLKSNIPE